MIIILKVMNFFTRNLYLSRSFNNLIVRNLKLLLFRFKIFYNYFFAIIVFLDTIGLFITFDQIFLQE